MKKLIVILVLVLLIAGCSSQPKVYNDGVYEGTAEGKYGPITLSVTIAKDKISKIETVSHQETPGLTDAVFTELPELIIEGQSTEDVDVFSGVTATSNAIIEAVEQALAKAKK